MNRTSRTALVVLTTAWLVLALSGCGGSSDDADATKSAPESATESAADPIAAAHLRPAGTPLPDGLTVPEGTQLLGPVIAFPTADPAPPPGPSSSPPAWRAIFLVDGPPLAAWDAASAELAQAVGLESPSSGAGCVVSDSDLECTWWLTFVGTAPFQAVQLWLGSPPNNVTGRWVVELKVINLAGPGTPRPDSAPPAQEGSDTPPEQPEAVAPPSPGDPLDPRTVNSGEDFTLLDGGQLVADLDDGGATGGVTALVALDESTDLPEQTDGYVDQCRAVFAQSEEPATSTMDVDGYTITAYDFDVGAGAGTCLVESFANSGDGPDYVLVDRQSD